MNKTISLDFPVYFISVSCCRLFSASIGSPNTALTVPQRGSLSLAQLQSEVALLDGFDSRAVLEVSRVTAAADKECASSSSSSISGSASSAAEAVHHWTNCVTLSHVEV